jgi:hypothetical protein
VQGELLKLGYRVGALTSGGSFGATGSHPRRYGTPTPAGDGSCARRAPACWPSISFTSTARRRYGGSVRNTARPTVMAREGHVEGNGEGELPPGEIE